MPPRKKLPILAAEISKNSIEQVSLSLQDLPEKPKDSYSLREAIALMHSAITTALSRGYKHEEISKLLADEGIKITASSLRRYLSITKPKGEAKAKAKRQTRTPKAVSETTATEPAPTRGKPGRKPKALSENGETTTPARRGPKPSTEPKTTTRRTATATTTRRRKTT